jgi:hypothetical protein
MGFYEGQDGPAVVKSAKSGTNGFKKGGKAEKAAGGCMKKGGKAVMSSAAKGKKPARATGGGVFSSAKAGTPRGSAPKPY